ncbi:MAG: ATP-dependent zinc metalloprotease FtsH [Acidimicrobiales bacterium]
MSSRPEDRHQHHPSAHLVAPAPGQQQPGRAENGAPQKDGKPNPLPQQVQWWRLLLIPVALVPTLLFFYFGGVRQEPVKTLPYSAFVSQVDAHKVTEVQADPAGVIQGRLADGTQFRSQVPTSLGETNLTSRLEKAGVKIQASGPKPAWTSTLLGFLPLAVVLGLFVWMGRRASKQVGALRGGLGALGRSGVKVIDSERPTTRFSDVAGYTGVKREVGELIEFLRSPDRYRRAGAVGPKGVLMVGPPGTGKTLLARAIAGEAHVPFLSVTGSAFVELFVGMGASRVRDLFDQARKLAPSIIFIDEIDAIGQRRGGSAAVANDEREQTINQLLSEMDGFDPADGVVVLAATNRPDVLDPALLRPGRFDRQVTIPLPNQAERRAILAVHCRKKRLGPDVDLDEVGRATPGFSGADLANLANEAAIQAVRDDREVLTRRDFDEARDRILLGLRDASNALLPDEAHAVAVHEAGHALVAALSPFADPVAKVTILPAGQALGVTQQLPVDERHLFSESYLKSSLAVRLGGRASELVCLGEASTGAANDLAGATDLATRMVREFGLSPALGPVGYGTTSPMYLGRDQVTLRGYSEATQRAIDTEVARLLGEAEKAAVALLSAHRGTLGTLVNMLVERETVSGEDVYRLLEATPSDPGAPAQPVAVV